MVSQGKYITKYSRAAGAAALKGAVMITIILMIIAAILFLGMVGDKEKINKRIYLYGFVACVVTVMVLEVVRMVA